MKIDVSGVMSSSDQAGQGHLGVRVQETGSRLGRRMALPVLPLPRLVRTVIETEDTL